MTWSSSDSNDSKDWLQSLHWNTFINSSWAIFKCMTMLDWYLNVLRQCWHVLLDNLRFSRIGWSPRMVAGLGSDCLTCTASAHSSRFVIVDSLCSNGLEVLWSSTGTKHKTFFAGTDFVAILQKYFDGWFQSHNEFVLNIFWHKCLFLWYKLGKEFL